MFNARVAIVFSGQGTQYVGMGRICCEDFPVAREIFDLADRVLAEDEPDFSLSKTCFKGSEEDLAMTINAQPAILTVSYIYYLIHREQLQLRGLEPIFVAGHSLGYYTALVVANAIDFVDAVRLVRERGRLMQKAAEETPGGMVAILGLDKEIIGRICKETGVEISNFNCTGGQIVLNQIVISGLNESLVQACERAKEMGARKVYRLPTAGAFHSRWMLPTEAGMRDAFSRVKLRNSDIPIIGNSNAEPLSSPDEIMAESIRQLSSPVQWVGSIERMTKEGVSTFIEVGPGKVLSGLIKGIDPKVTVIHIKEVVG